MCVNALKACSSSDTGSDCAKGASVVCEKLDTKYNSYSSFHVTMSVDSVVFYDAIDCLMSSEVWPMGMLVRRYFFKKRNGDSE